MAGQKNRTQLQALFKSGAKPSEENFKDFINSVLNIHDDGLEKPAGADNPLKILAHGEAENLLDCYAGDLQTWRLNQKPMGANPGFNLETGGVSKLFVESSTGNLGLSTIQPTAKLHIQQSGSQDALRIDDTVKDTTPLVVDTEGKVGIGIPVPERKLQVEGGELRVRASHNNVTADIGAFYAENLTQGIGIGYNQIAAIGSNKNQDIQLTPKGTGKLSITSNTVVSKALIVGQTSATGYKSVTADDNDLVVNGQFAAGGSGGSAIYKLGVGYAPPSQGEGTLVVSGKVGIRTANPALDLAIGDTDTGLKQQGDGKLAIYTNNVERVRFDQTGYVGIGVTNPRSALDTGKGVVSGAGNDYVKAQFTLSGGGTVTWAGPGGRLKWTQRFIAISMEKSVSFSEGHVNIDQPTSNIPAANVYDGKARSATADGVVLKAWEALYAIHTVGGSQTAVSFQIVRYTHAFNAPSNWVLVAVVNADNNTIKLGTGVTLSKNTSSTKGSPIPTGVIMMWFGAANNLPDGWALCNGQNGTPDLRDRFIVAAGSNAYEPGASGNPDSHTHAVNPPNTNLSINSAGAHTHKFPDAWYNRSFDGGGKTGIDVKSQNIDTATTQSSGSHTHTGAVNIPQFNSGSSSGLNRPKWYALCFIMKL
ncbi:MAG: hypothetical protein QNJ46_09270 [Leptolyngbyaceae cyanobacterium MO_188.B28]|nr:hypothetical protein [Leptolyngbyaceae cyanobacterium MO_188.B28]